MSYVEGQGYPPENIILGCVIGEWPVHAFTSDTHALAWIAEDLDRRRLWECGISDATELRYVPPGQARLERKT